MLDEEWVELLPVERGDELDAFGRYAALLVGDNGRNRGECGVLALAEVHHWTAIIEDHEAYSQRLRE
ncbi:hypothetical protein [Propionibacterium australiense]|uniref:hypothetical protein n=1 Tax=Propionibacterium australiense TaxID=119981 RepID=UPI000F81C61C|nr:hypothetical protein [Propionibacterium australiense]